MPSAREGVVFEREGTKVRDTARQAGRQAGSQAARQPAAMDTGEHTASNDLRVAWER